MHLFDRHAEPPIPLLTGDRVRFYPVSPAEVRLSILFFLTLGVLV